MTSLAYGMAGLECPEQSYKEAQTDPRISLMVGFVKEDMWAAGGRRTAPDLYGVSGCGLWRYGRQIRHARRPPLLSAITIEWHRHNRDKYVLGTRIHVAIGALTEKYPDVREFVSAQVA
jgi:hypothetical protein